MADGESKVIGIMFSKIEIGWFYIILGLVLVILAYISAPGGAVLGGPISTVFCYGGCMTICLAGLLKIKRK